MATEPQIYAIGTCALGIHASFLITVSIYHFLLISVEEKILRTTPALLVPQVSSCLRYVVEFIPKGGNNEPFKLFMQNKPNLLNTQMNITKVLTKEYENIRLLRRAENKPKQTQRT